MDTFLPWSVAGSYYEVCNCEAICPCRRSRGEKAGRPMYENCDFALSWWIKQGHAGAIDLAGLKVVMAGRWETTPGDPWRVILYVDDRGRSAQQTGEQVHREDCGGYRRDGQRGSRRESRYHAEAPPGEKESNG